MTYTVSQSLFTVKNTDYPSANDVLSKITRNHVTFDNIGDVILELVKKLDDERLEIEEAKPHLKDLDSKYKLVQLMQETIFSPSMVRLTLRSRVK